MSKVWFITGSSRGLGRAITVAALEAGHQVVATARRPEQLADLAGKYGDRLHTARLDVTDAAAAEAAVQDAAKRFGRLDVVINNAGYGDLAALEDMTLEAFRAQVDAVFYGTVYVSKAAVPILREQGSGHLVQISSIGGRLGSPGLSAYQASKWAVGGFSEALAKEVTPLGVKVTVVEPGGMRTDWSGSSMTIPPVSAPYEQTVGAIVGFLGQSDGGPTSAEGAAEVVLKLTELDEPPMHLLLGTDAVAIGAQLAEGLAKSDAAHRELSESASD